MQIRNLTFLFILSIAVSCKPTSEGKSSDSLLWPLIQSSIDTQQKCQQANTAKATGANCFQLSTNSLIYNTNTSSFVAVGTATISAGAKLQCKCPSTGTTKQNSWYTEVDATKQPILIAAAPSSYYTNNQTTLENYSVGDVLYCGLTTADCSIGDYLYQKIRIVP
ncbi:hypothetical protein AB3N59_20200 (plasmid) [Leptospira sp. WS92.C1]